VSMIKFGTYDNDYATVGQVKSLITGDSSIMEGVNYTLPKSYGTQPQVPYHAGDIYTLDGKSYTCITTRTTGSFTQSDWSEAVPANKIIAYTNASSETERIGKTRLDADLVTTDQLTAHRVDADHINAGTFEGFTIKGSSITGNTIFCGGSGGGNFEYYNGYQFFSIGKYSNNCWASAYTSAMGDGNGYYIYSGTNNNSPGDTRHWRTSSNGSRILTESLNGLNYNIQSANHIHLHGSGYTAITAGSNPSYGSNNGSIYLYSGAHITLHAGSSDSYYVYIGHGSGGNSRAAVDSNGPSSRCLKKDIIKYTPNEYDDALALLKDIDIYNYHYKYKNLHPKKDQFGFIIDDLLDNPLAEKFFYFKDEQVKEKDGIIDYLIEDGEKPNLEFKRYDEETLIKYLLVCSKALQNKIDELEAKLNEK